MTDRCLEILQSIPNLERVEAHFTSFSKKGIESFHRNRPNCRIQMEENPVQVPVPEPENFQDEDLLFPGHGEDAVPQGEVIIIDINRNAENNNHNL